MIEFDDVRIAYKDKPVLDGVSLTIHDREFFVLIGSSGCGKTTLLKSINKLLPLRGGSLSIDGIPVEQIKVQDLPKKVGYVVQSGGLFPHLTVEENIALTMQIARFSKEAIRDRVDKMLKMVNLDWKSTGASTHPSSPAVSSSGWASPGLLPPIRPSS